MMIITKSVTIDMAHRLHFYKGVCRFVHGHTWKFSASVSGDPTPEEAIVVDFGELKKEMWDILEQLDHSLLLYQHDPILQKLLNAVDWHEWNIQLLSAPPTSENLAKYLFHQLWNKHYSVVQTVVEETPTSYAMFVQETSEGLPFEERISVCPASSL